MGKQAVDAPRRNYFMMNPHDLKVVGVDTDHKSAEDHYLWDARIKLPVDQALVNNIRTYGVLRPVTAIKDGEDCLTVDGRRRVIHARLAYDAAVAAGEEPPLIPVIFIRGDEAHVFGVSRVHNRFGRSETIMQDAANAQRMIDLGKSEDEVAVAYGVKRQTIKDWLSLLGLAASVRKAVDAGEISPSAAAGLAQLSKDEQEKHLEKLKAEGAKPTVERVVRQVREAQGKKALKTPSTRLKDAKTKMLALADTCRRSTVAMEALDEVAKILFDKGITDIAMELEEAKAKDAEADDGN